MTEVLRPVPGHPRYHVSSEGRVWSWRAGRWLTATPDSHGYLRVSLDGRTYRVHVLVAAAFLGERPAGLHVCHGPGGQLDNRLANLRYDTPEANEQDKRKRKSRRRKGSQAQRATFSSQVVMTGGEAACKAS